ncbi:MAG: glycosidase, partial [Phycisphaerae bacterium]
MTASILHRCPSNPILTAEDVAQPCTQVFNAGVAYWKGRYVMVFRADTYSHEKQQEVDTFLGLAES